MKNPRDKYFEKFNNEILTGGSIDFEEETLDICGCSFDLYDIEDILNDPAYAPHIVYGQRSKIWKSCLVEVRDIDDLEPHLVKIMACYESQTGDTNNYELTKFMPYHNKN